MNAEVRIHVEQMPNALQVPVQTLAEVKGHYFTLVKNGDELRNPRGRNRLDERQSRHDRERAEARGRSRDESPLGRQPAEAARICPIRRRW